MKEYHNIFHLQPDSKEDISCFRDIELHTIELSKFATMPEQTETSEQLQLLLPQVKTALDRWAAFLSRYYLFKSDQLPEAMNRPEVKKAFNTLEEMRLSKEEREIYENHLKWFRDEASALEKKGEESFKEGLEQGFQEGLEKGIEKGRVEEKLTMAKALLQRGVEVPIVAEASGLSPEELQQLQKEPSPS